MDEGIPLVAISVKEASRCGVASHDNRYSVTLCIEIFYPELAASFAATKGARKGDQGNTWDVVVYVKDKICSLTVCVGSLKIP